MQTIIWDNKVPYSIAQVRLTSNWNDPPHNHDFAEVIWVESGAGQHLVNGEIQSLSTGDVVFIRPADTHAFRIFAGHALVIVNIAFPFASLAFMRARYFPEETGLFWTPQIVPDVITLHGEHQLRMGEIVRELAQATRTRFHVERFLINLLYDISSSLPSYVTPQSPRWVRELCACLDDPAITAEGVPALVEAAGRSAEHVARSIKRWTGKTPTELVNDARLNLVATQLCMSDAAILDIAMDAGFVNLSHFNALFRKRFHLTPRQYRQRHKTVYGRGEW